MRSRWLRAELGLALATALVGCADRAVVAQPAGPWAYAPPPPSTEAPLERGLASYYADRFAGRRTASGEPYDPLAFSAAHRSLPLGTVIEVARDDGRRVTVRVNDRGPYEPGRVVDLSRAAADAIGMVREGVVPVTVRLVGVPRR